MINKANDSGFLNCNITQIQIHYVADPILELKKGLPNYIHDIKKRNSEYSKSMAFASFIQKTFGIKAEELDFEVSVDTRVLELKGRIDAVFGNIIIEFKRDLKKGLDTAKDELKKYFQAYKEKFPNTKFIGIANDGIFFKVFQPIFKENVIDDLEEIGQINLEESTPEQVFNWFDAYFFTSTKVVPTSEHIKQNFGLNSPTYAVVKRELLGLFEKIKDIRSVKTKYENWAKYLEIVYGDRPSELNLFISHTYLSTFAKLLVFLKISSKENFRNYSIPPILYGNVFSQYGILNFVEEDFFSWIMFITIRKKASEIFEKLLRDLEVYDLDQINEDVLKELYQEMVHPDIRKQLGEFYTPDWLAQKMIIEVLQNNPNKSVLDPSCGSGTFLFKTILYKIENLEKMGLKKSEILEHILKNVVGFDIHPLAALIAKTNYLLALRDILHERKGTIAIPVYLSDSLKIPSKKMEITNAVQTFELETQFLDKRFSFPLNIVENITKMDDVIEKMKEHGHEFENRVKTIRESSYKINIDEVYQNLLASFKRSIDDVKDENEKYVLIQNVNTLFDLIKENFDSIWPYVLRNMYKPIAFSLKKTDILIGNPPWISLRYMKNEIYQNYIKTRSKHYGLIDSYNFQNIANMELASLFFTQCVDQYLVDNGQIAFVMPQSIIIASQHKNFRSFKKPQLKLTNTFDLEHVEPLFRIPSCVIFAKKKGVTKYPVPMTKVVGKLQSNNVQLEEAQKHLKFEKTKYEPNVRKKKGGYYYDLFQRGAEITPRNFWFVDIESSNFLAFNPKKPYVKSAENRDSKKPWNRIKVDGNVEKQFFFNTILGPDLIPFGYLRRRLIILPIIVYDNQVEILSSNSQEISSFDFKKFLEKIEVLWKENATEKLKKKPIYEQVNYNNNLISQVPNSKYKVIYAANGANMTCSVINAKEKYINKIGSSEFITDTFFVDMAMYYTNVQSEKEGYYLSSILNSSTINEYIKPHQSRGDFGARNIHKAPLTYDIPKFNEKNPVHLELANTGIICNKKTKEITSKLNLRGIGTIRNKVREGLKEEMEIIENLISKL